MKKFNKILSLMLVLAMVLSMAACGGSSTAETQAPAAAETEAAAVTYVDPYADLADDYDALSAAIYEDVLGEFNEVYQVAKAATNPSESWALSAIAEAKLMEAALMVPLYGAGGTYRMARMAPYTKPSVSWGYDNERYHNAVMTVEPLTSDDANHLIGKYAELRGTGTYETYAADYLTGKGYTLKDTFTQTYSTDPINWDCLITSRASEGEVCCNLWDGLVEYDCENVMQPALATSWEVSEDGLTYTFHIREGVKWVDSQGRVVDEVTADDWVAGMQHMMDAMGGLEWLIDGKIVGANGYITGDITDFSEVGVKAVDDYTLQYTLEAPCTYFMSMLSYSLFSPMSREFYESQGGKFGAEYDAAAADYLYGATPENMAYCGPYTVTNATAQNTIVFSLNPEYWNKDNVRVKTITWLYNDGSDATKAINDFMAGVTDYINLGTSSLEIAKNTMLEDGSNNWFDAYNFINYTDGTSYMGFYNVNRMAMENVSDGAAKSSKTEEDVIRGNAAMRNVHFRRALTMAFDRGAYNAQFNGEDLKFSNVRNSYTPANFIALEEDVTVDINGTATTFAKGTLYGEIMQAQIDADGVAIKVYDAATGSGDGFDGYYNPENAAAELAIAIEELAAIGVEVSAENPIYVDMPYNSAATNRTNSSNAYKQSIESVLGGAVIVNLVKCNNVDEWRYTGYYTDYGYEANYDMYDLSGWGPDYGDPSTYLDTFLPDYAGYMIKCLGIF